MNIEQFFKLVTSDNKYNLVTEFKEKKLIDIFQINIDDIEIGVVINYLIDYDSYEVYLYIIKDMNIVSNLCYKIFSEKIDALKYYNIIERHISNNDIISIFKLLKK